MEAAGRYQVDPQAQDQSNARDSLIKRADQYRMDASRRLDPANRSRMGQFFTVGSIAQFMASLFGTGIDEIRLLDAGAGVGSLTAAFVERVCQEPSPPRRLSVVVYELESLLVEYLHLILAQCRKVSEECGIAFEARILEQDFVDSAVEMLRGGLFAVERLSFNRAILNPPYKKIRSDSQHRRLLNSIGLETTNLYAAFLALAADLLEEGGELVAITPRSFCNGPYFKPFRKRFLRTMTLRRIHIYESREEAFSTDGVLQENIIVHAVKAGEKGDVLVSASQGPAGESMTLHSVNYEQVVRPDDPNLIIHLATSEMDQFVLDRLSVFDHTLEKLGVEVSTGRVVDFRVRELLRSDPQPGTVPLIYPTHFQDGYVLWPKPGGKKPNAISNVPEAGPLFLPTGYYVLVRRFSAKEEPRRVVPAIFEPQRIPASWVAFENHLNVYHRKGAGLPPMLAKGLALFLNSTLVDSYFRQFNGHTQVNATDLRMLRYPSPQILEALGRQIDDKFPSQEQVDRLLEREIQRMADIVSPDPVAAKQKVNEALTILELLGFPRGQLNDRSALTLLALLELEPKMSWSQAKSPLKGITPLMDFCRETYGKNYAPNTRETVRRQTMHQFIDAGLVVANPDDPSRPINSPKFCYQIEPTALKLLRSFGTEHWTGKLEKYLASVETLKNRYARARNLSMIPVTLAEAKMVYLTPGEHSKLVQAVIEEFAPRFVPGGRVLYVGDTGNKWRYFDRDALQALGVSLDIHGKMPDVVIHHVAQDWLVLVEAVTSHGPVDPKRRQELAALFKDARPGLVYVTAFLTRSDMARYVGAISWETEVWVQEASAHLIHFDGEKFLGPYEAG